MPPAPAAIEIPTNPGEWETVGVLVLHELRRLNEATAATAHALSKITIDMAVSKARSGWWGAFAGVLSSAIVSIVVALIVKALN